MRTLSSLVIVAAALSLAACSAPTDDEASSPSVETASAFSSSQYVRGTCTFSRQEGNTYNVPDTIYLAGLVLDLDGRLSHNITTSAQASHLDAPSFRLTSPLPADFSRSDCSYIGNQYGFDAVSVAANQTGQKFLYKTFSSSFSCPAKSCGVTGSGQISNQGLLKEKCVAVGIVLGDRTCTVPSGETSAIWVGPE